MLGAWKGVPYAERLCRRCDLGKVKDEKHLLFVYLNTKKVRERFCLALPLTHTSTLIELMQITNTSPGQVCGMLPIPKDNLSSMICLSSNGLSGPKRM